MNLENQGKIRCRIIQNRQKQEFVLIKSLPKIKKNDWDYRKQEVKSSNPYSSTYNLEICNIKKRLEELKLKHVNNISNLQIRYITDLLKGKTLIEYTIITLAETMVQRKREISKNMEAASQMKQLIPYLYDFINTNNKHNLKWESFNKEWIMSFEEYLKQKKSEQYNRPLSQNTIYKKMENLRQLVKWAYEYDLIKKNYFENCKLTKPRMNKQSMNKEQIKQLIEIDYKSDRQKDKVRDVFLFTCYTGIAYQDSQNLTHINLKNDDQFMYIEYLRNKTSICGKVPIINRCQEIILKYKESDSRIIKNSLIPQLCNAHINRTLKSIQNDLGLSFKLTHHIARHTFATLLNDIVITEKTRAMMMGHTQNSNFTMGYGEVTLDALKNAGTAFEKYLN